ncbi:uncharacterized protein LOC114350344 [Ostrinia furnacalis]|uniref:uncharacterized protein LOC114350344 n=1 Tax=Ostrinia furnacalis TaxID=93504 RepID=UPI00103D010C|nr:uncharacterized protein LOC114350344 [Ostrinia furnacalis]
MLSAIKLVVSENGKLIDSVTKETNTQTNQLLKSLEVFQRSANDALTKLIEKQCGDGDSGHSMDDMDDIDEEDDADEQVSPRKKKK